ncbi:MAG TPA: zinc-ribbon domain-containing protein, partial [Anaerolineaceae bacterium]|nr:zinc-ribbon domain-containing protein [Anaerolineaceae bacterium]
RVYSGFNDLATAYPLLATEWHPNKNGDKKPENTLPGTHDRIWWLCSAGHEWEAVVYSRMKTGCPYCSGSKPVTGVNDLETLYHDLCKQWNHERNGETKPSDLLPQSNKKVWWICSLGHEWQSIPGKRISGNGCPVCGNRKIIAGFNDLSTVNPILAEEWNHEKNGSLKPSMVSAGANKKVWWQCPVDGHEWRNTVGDRNSGKGCGVCTNHILMTGVNDLATRYPEVANEWHPEKNDILSPADIVATTHKRAWWKCNNGHEWNAVISSRTTAGKGCRFCAGQAAVSGVNDLQTVNPALASEWNTKLNSETFIPSMVLPGSNLKAWWECSQGHEWEAVISSRNRGLGCRTCSGAGTSKTQKEFYEELLHYFPQMRNDVKIDIAWKSNRTMNLDCFSILDMLVVEYDGFFYHSGERSGKGSNHHLEHDAIKTETLLKTGYRVVRIRESGLLHLPISSPSLLQVSHRKGSDKADIVQKIYEWFIRF